MKHVTYAQKSLLIGDEAADLLLEYAATLAARKLADTVNVNVVSADGNDIIATILLATGAPLMSESTHSSMNEPDNATAIGYMRERIALLTQPPPVLPDSERMPDYYEDLNL